MSLLSRTAPLAATLLVACSSPGEDSSQDPVALQSAAATGKAAHWVSSASAMKFVLGSVAAPIAYQDLSTIARPVVPLGDAELADNALGVNPDTLQERLSFPKTRAAFDALRSPIAKGVDSHLGVRPPFPSTVIVQTDSVVHTTAGNGLGYTVTRFRFHNGADAVVPGIFVMPDHAAQEAVPLVLYCHYHGGEFDVGKESLFEHGRLWPRSNQNHDFDETRNVDPAWLGDWPAGVNNLAELYASPGYAVLSIDEYGFRERSGKGPGGPDQTGAAEIDAIDALFASEGRSRFGMGIRDKQIALEWASRQPGIDRTRRAATGMSMGSWTSMYMGFAEPTLNPIVPIAGLGVDDLGLLSMLAPDPVLAPNRRVFNMNGDGDPGNAPVADGIFAKGVMATLFHFYGEDANYQNVVVPKMGHEMTVAEVLKALDFMKATWSPRP